MHPDNSSSHPSCFRVPRNVIPHLETLGHFIAPRIFGYFPPSAVAGRGTCLRQGCRGAKAASQPCNRHHAQPASPTRRAAQLTLALETLAFVLDDGRHDWATAMAIATIPSPSTQLAFAGHRRCVQIARPCAPWLRQDHDDPCAPCPRFSWHPLSIPGKTSDIRPQEIGYARARNAGTRSQKYNIVSIRDLAKNHSLVLFMAALVVPQLADASMLSLVGEQLAVTGQPQSSLSMSGLIIIPQIVVALLAPWVGYHSEKKEATSPAVGRFWAGSRARRDIGLERQLRRSRHGPTA